LWRLPLGIVLTLIAVASTYEVWADIVGTALRDEESSQITLVPVVAVWLFWVRRGRLRFCEPRGTIIGPLFVAVGWLLYSQGDTYLIDAFWHLGAILMAVGGLLSVLGSGVLLRFMPAFAILVMLVPVPGMIRHMIAGPLESITAQLTENLMSMLGAAVTREGNVLILNGQTVKIAEACNGLRLVFALFLVSYAFAFVTPLKGYVRVLLLLASPLSAILCNVIRLVPTVWLYGYASKDSANFFHDVSGWIMLGISFLILMGIIRLLRWALIPVTIYTLAYQE
jgi:exosortase